LVSAGAPYSFVVDSALNTVTKIEASVAVEATPSTQLPNNAVIKGTNFLVTFGEDYDANSISASTITIKDSAGTAVDCAITFPTAKTVLLDPNADLTPGETYTVEVNGVKSKIGNTFKTYRATAIVADTTAPKVSAITPADGAVSIAVNSGVTIKFDKPLDPATVIKANFMVSKNANLSAPMDATVTYDSATNTVTVKPASFMEKGTVYYVGINETTVKGANGVAVNANGSATKALGSFTTANVAIAPKITSATMYKGAADAHTMVITFEVPTGATLTGQDKTTYLFGGTTWDGTATYTADLSAGAVSTTLTGISDAHAALVTSNVSTIAVNAEAVAAKALKDVNGVLFDTTPVKITKVGW
jgi:methionine-rich copper-binding protein CopC